MEHIINKLNVIINIQNKKIKEQDIKINNLENIINYNKSNLDLLYRLIKELETKKN